MEIDFERDFERLTCFAPLRWQSRLYSEYLASGKVPAALDIPTGLGKTSVMAIWYLALKGGANLPRRLLYVVDRRAVVDQATAVADQIKTRSADAELRVSTLRGQHVDNREWLEDPTTPAIIVGTVDMIGSRLLFSGYGVSRKMRPYHAGLLGADTLVVLDESHLVPPFEKLLEAIDSGIATFGPRENTDRSILPPLKLLSLSATGLARSGTVFCLEEEKGDLEDTVVKKRLSAKKHLTIESMDGKKLEEALADHAWMVCDDGKKAIRVLVYCDKRDVAEKTKEKIQEKARGGKKNNVPKVDIQEPELFVGARRVKERVDATERLKALGFLAGSSVKLESAAFLIATSAGEVGVDLDADHMVCDLVSWERMVQRLGRVNRLGNGDARISIVIDLEPTPSKKEQEAIEKRRKGLDLDEKEQKLIDAFEQKLKSWRSLRELIEKLPQNRSGIDASPGALLDLKRRAELDAHLQDVLQAATTMPPLYPALTRPLVDAWSMTSLDKHTGRPKVAPWLRGWVQDDEPETTIVWRRYLPVRSEGGEASNKEIEDFFEAAPPHMSEKLGTETWRAIDWMVARAEMSRGGGTLSDKEIVAFALSADGDLLKSYHLHDLFDINNDKKREERLKREIAGAMIVVDARLGGLKDGLLDNTTNDENIPTADDGFEWPAPVLFSIRAVTGDDIPDSSTRIVHVFATKRSIEGVDIERLLIETETTEDARATTSYLQLLEEHASRAVEQTRRIARLLKLPDENARALAIAARLHDEGKKAVRWQRAFNAPRDDIYAKTKGPVVQSRLGGYRHEFGSLSEAERDGELRGLDPDLQALVLHLIAAHHGRARPVIEIEGCEDAPPTLLEARAREVTLRFARLQKRWGPWGLAWWEALLRAADQQASRQNSQEGRAHGRS